MFSPAEMKNVTLILITLIASMPLLAAEEPAATEKPCRANSCLTSIEMLQFSQMAFKTGGLSLNQSWVKAHGREMIDSFADECSRHNDCLATPGNDFAFCDEVLALEALTSCDSMFPRKTNQTDWDQCRTFVSAWALAVDQRVPDTWRSLQACAKKLPERPDKRIVVSISPKRMSFEKEQEFFVTSIDPETNTPVYGRILFNGQTTPSRADPSGRAGTYYKFKYRLKPVRERGEDGHYRIRWPEITVNPQHYPKAVIQYEAPPLPEMLVTIRNRPRKVKVGKNTLDVSAVDSVTRKETAGTVVDDDGFVLGSLGQPIKINAVKKGKRVCLGPLWARSNNYSDTAVQIPSSWKCD